MTGGFAMDADDAFDERRLLVQDTTGALPTATDFEGAFTEAHVQSSRSARPKLPWERGIMATIFSKHAGG